MRRRWLVVTALALCSCTGGVIGSSQVVGSVKIAAELPLSGDDAIDGLPVKDAIELALKQAGSACGAASHQDACVHLQLVAYDDVMEGIHDPAKGAKNVQLMASDDQVVGMVGPLYDSLARSELPVANAVKLGMISPVNNDECLTQEPSDGHCHGLAARLRPRGGNNYFRVSTTQLAEGAAAADLASKTLGKRRALVVRDPSAFSQAASSTFISHFERNGGGVLKTFDLGPEGSPPPSFVTSLQDAKAAKVDVVFFAGVDLQVGAALRRELGTQMPEVPMVATDRIASTQFPKAAGANARASYYMLVGPYPPNVSRAANFLRDYRSRYSRDASTAALQAFEATNVLIAAIRRAVDDAGGHVPNREQVLTQLAKTKEFNGLTGSFGFDGRGDITLRLVSAYQWIAPTDRAGRFTAQLSVN
jgi:branched-chain amino acid transport system substrate-binding protein